MEKNNDELPFALMAAYLSKGSRWKSPFEKKGLTEKKKAELRKKRKKKNRKK